MCAGRDQFGDRRGRHVADPDRLAELQKMLRHRLADIAESDESDRRLASPWQFQIVTARSAGARHAAPKQSSGDRSEEHTSELQSLMRISYAVFCLKKKKKPEKQKTIKII